MSDEKPCRHEYVRIYQRKLKGLERRLVGTRAYLPVGFKQSDLSHLTEGSFCFCTTCRARLFPKRTAADKAAARLALAQGKAAVEAEDLEERTNEPSAEPDIGPAIAVDELEVEAVDVQDIEAEGVKLPEDDAACQLLNDDEVP